MIAGLGGRPIMAASLRRVPIEPDLPSLTFLDLDERLAVRELARDSGPHAENEPGPRPARAPAGHRGGGAEGHDLAGRT